MFDYIPYNGSLFHFKTAKAGLELVIHLPQPSQYGITDVYHHIWLIVALVSSDKPLEQNGPPYFNLCLLASGTNPGPQVFSHSTEVNEQTAFLKQLFSCFTKN